MALSGVGGLKWAGSGETNSDVKVYRYPRIGRAVFHLATLPRLPEVENLFEVPITKIRVKYPGNLTSYAAAAAEVKKGYPFKSSDLSDAEFPLFLTDTMPEQIVAEFEAMSGMRLYHDREAGLLTDRKPPGLLERLADWWRLRGPGWFL